MPRVILKLGDDISTDIIYPGRYMATVLPSETPAHAFADYPVFRAALDAGAVPPGSVVAAGRNFGCGSSREQAASCLKGHELAVVARSFARIFLQNAINLGLKVILAPTFEANEGDEDYLEPEVDRVLQKDAGSRSSWLPRSRRTKETRSSSRTGAFSTSLRTARSRSTRCRRRARRSSPRAASCRIRARASPRLRARAALPGRRLSRRESGMPPCRSRRY